MKEKLTEGSSHKTILAEFLIICSFTQKIGITQNTTERNCELSLFVGLF